MADLCYVLCSLVIGAMLAVGFLVQAYEIKLLSLRSAGHIAPWLIGTTGKSLDQSKASKTPVFQEPLPLSDCSREWWENVEIFQLEKRAIFSKSWILVTHACRFKKSGDYRTFDIAGLSVIVILGKDQRLRSFQNVCRHRAYQITKKDCGSSTVLGCRYHGWSYDTKGHLIKAPEFENIPGFDKTKNALWEVRTRLVNSLVYVNFDAREDIPATHFGTLTEVCDASTTEDFRCAMDWKVEGSFNWKIAAGDFSIRFPSLEKRSAFWHSILSPRFRGDLKSETTGPACFIRRLPSGDLITLRFLPNSPRVTTVECCIYTRSKENKGSELQYDNVRKEIQTEVERMENKQRSVIGGEMGFSRQKQDELRRVLQEHIELEERNGMKVYPAAQKRVFTSEGRSDDDFCRELDDSARVVSTVCSDNFKGLLDW